MNSKAEAVVSRLERWSPTGFIVTGLGFLAAVALLVVDTVTSVTVPELYVAVLTVPTFLVLTLVALPGFYPYVADASPRLALGGVLAATVAAASVTVVTVGKLVLHLLGVIGFTEEGPLIAGFFVWLVAFFLSVLCYGVASVRSGAPSRVVGVLLLVVVAEPAVTLLNDLVGVDVDIIVAFLTLGIAGGAFLALGVVLRRESAPDDHGEPAPGTPA
jgi:hypothetical protein